MKCWLQLDAMAYTFASQFNVVHQSGWSPEEIQRGKKVSKISFLLWNPTNRRKPKRCCRKNQRISCDFEDEIILLLLLKPMYYRVSWFARMFRVKYKWKPCITGIYDTNLKKSCVSRKKINITLTNRV